SIAVIASSFSTCDSSSLASASSFSYYCATPHLPSFPTRRSSDLRYKNMALAKPIIHNAPDKTFYNWMKSRGKLGGQNKVPRLANNRDYLDPLLKIIHN